MGSLFEQVGVVTGMSVRSIPQRWGMSLATVFSVAAAVAVLLWFLALANGFAQTLQGTGTDDVAVALRAGSQTELNSGLSRDQVRLLEEAPGVARTAGDQPLASAELYVIVDGYKRSTLTEVNLPLRGVEDQAAAVRGGTFAITQGRMFEPGSNELIVGEAVLREFTGFELGREVDLGNATWVVVGVFSVGGSVFESELWADAPVVQNLFNRGATYQSMRLKLTDPAQLAAVQEFVDNEPRLQLDVLSEREFFADQSGQLRYLSIIGWVLGVVMAIGAIAGALNAMIASVDARTRDIATLRAIGFSGFSAFIGAMAESLTLAVIGGVIGALATFLLFDGLSASTLGSGFTQVVFRFELSPQLIINGVVLAGVIGLVGGLWPALRAANAPLMAVHQG